MADGMGIIFFSVEVIAKIVQAITTAVETVRHNKVECEDIAQCVVSVSAVLNGIYQSTREMAMVPAMHRALEDLKVSLERALRLVTDCQRQDVFRRILGARDMAAELRRVQDDITRKVTLGILTAHILTNVMLSNMQFAAPSPSPAPPLWMRPMEYVLPQPMPWPRLAPLQLAPWEKPVSMADFCCPNPNNWHR